LKKKGSSSSTWLPPLPARRHGGSRVTAAVLDRRRTRRPSQSADLSSWSPPSISTCGFVPDTSTAVTTASQPSSTPCNRLRHRLDLQICQEHRRGALFRQDHSNLSSHISDLLKSKNPQPEFIIGDLQSSSIQATRSFKEYLGSSATSS
jgi:fructosamine-3-kinase